MESCSPLRVVAMEGLPWGAIDVTGLFDPGPLYGLPPESLPGGSTVVVGSSFL